MMTLQDIQAAIASIESLNGDNESQHAKEDELRDKFIKFVAAHGSLELATMAKEVLKTGDMDFCRWCG